MNLSAGNDGSEPEAALARFLADHAAAGHWPGGVIAVGPPETVPRFLSAAGSLALIPDREPSRTDALYDLASLTKPLSTALVALRLSQAGKVDLDEPQERFLPEMRGYAGRTPSVADLLLHRSGLPAWRPLYRLAEDPSDLPRTIAVLPPVGSAGTRAVYSCLGPILAAVALSRATGMTIRELFHREVLAPLSLHSTELDFGPILDARLARTAPTEAGRRFEAQVAAPGPDYAGITEGGEILRGTVHDGNAAFLGGQAGNAGLFGTAAAVFRVAAEVAAPGAFLGEGHWKRLAQAGISTSEDVRTLGFQSGQATGSPGAVLGGGSFGHVGFTGTSVWIDPARPLVAVLLTNRVHPRWIEAPIQSWRSQFHELAAKVETAS